MPFLPATICLFIFYVNLTIRWLAEKNYYVIFSIKEQNTVDEVYM